MVKVSDPPVNEVFELPPPLDEDPEPHADSITAAEVNNVSIKLESSFIITRLTDDSVATLHHAGDDNTLTFFSS
jgi:hypothetical protein